MSKIKLAIQGDPGANHHIMADKLMLSDYELVPAKTFREITEKLVVGEIDLGLMAIENSIAGSILGNFDLLSNFDVEVIAEGYLRIEHCLIGLPGANLKDIKTVYSHEMALKQCDDYLRTNDLEAREYFDTAASVEHIKKLGSKSNAGIAPALAAEIYGGKVLAKGIETNKQNYTRFVLLKKRKKDIDAQIEYVPSKKPLKTMVEFQLKHETGSLVSALNTMADSGFNMTKIESRPIVGESWHYKFYVDFLSNDLDAEIVKRLERLKSSTEYYNILGIFPQGQTYA